MKPSAQLQATVELLGQYEQANQPADRLMAKYFRERRYIGSKDKAAISHHFYAILRNMLCLDYLVDLVRPSARENNENVYRMAAHLSLSGEKLDSHFTGAKYELAKLPQLDLERLQTIEDSMMEFAPENVRLNVPAWLLPALKESLGDKLEQEAEAFNQQASTDLRVNTLKADRQQVFDELQQQRFACNKTDLSPWGIRFDKRVNIIGQDLFKQGCIEIQDEGSQLLSLLSAARPGLRVVDFCAGAGGKTLGIAAMMQNKGQIWACDVHSKRLEQLKKRQRRAGVHNVRVHHLSSENDKWVKQHAASADIVLLDSPCTGTGTWRRSPDARWRLERNDINELVALQRSILESACRLVKPGGTLIYATCSLLKEENEDQVGWFLAKNPQFSTKQIDLPDALQDCSAKLQIDGHQLRTFSALTNTDSFFMATMVRAR